MTRTLSLLAMALAMMGCTVDEPPPFRGAERVDETMTGGTPAEAFPEAVLVDMGDAGVCSGALIAERVVLTAGHCVAEATEFKVTAPYARNQSATGTRRWTDYTSKGGKVNSKANDVGVIVLDQPIMLDFYPPIARAREPDGTLVINVGRVNFDKVSFTELFYGKPVALKSGASCKSDFPLAYCTTKIIEPGDSGGPAYAGSFAKRVIVAVNSGAGATEQILARVDLVSSKLEAILAVLDEPSTKP